MISFQFLRFFLLPSLLAAVSPACAERPALSDTSSADPVLTVARVREGKSYRTEQLQPLRPVAHLKRSLPKLPPVNAQVVQALLAYPRDGQHTYYWPRKADGVVYDGCTTDVLLGDLQVMRGESQGRTFCCGLTLEVFYKTLAEQPRLPESLTSATASQFKKLWFCREINSPGPEEAMVAFGVGKKIRNPDKALPGDFVQLWRARKSGHSVVFVAWARNRQGQRVGLHYWSTQEGTDGIGFQTELFGNVDKGVRQDLLSISRLLPPEKWQEPAKQASASGTSSAKAR